MTITSFITGATLFAAVAIPVAANAEPRVEPAPAAATIAPAVNEQRRYCFQTEMTGSLIARQVCQTRAAWLREGVNVDRYVKRWPID